MQRVQGDATTGNVTIVTGGVSSTTIAEGSFPAATVTVYATGTLNLASIFSDNGVTPKANPFTAASDGSWFFYAANGRYDIALAATNLARTLGDVILFDPLGVTGQLVLKEIAAPAGVAGSEVIWADSTAHRLQVKDNNGAQIQLVQAGADINTSDQVTVTHLASPLPIAQGGTASATATGSGQAVLQTSPALVTPALGVASATSINSPLVSVDTIQQRQAAVGLSILDFNGVSHGFIAGVAPYTNTFISGNGSGVVFLGSAAKTSVDDAKGFITSIEIAAPAGVGGSDLFYADSTAHRWKMNNNNGGATNVLGASDLTATLKSGSGAGNYTSASTTYVRVDTTNLTYTVTIPVGFKLIIQASGAVLTATSAVGLNVALADGSADNTGILIETSAKATDTSTAVPFSLSWIVSGDGASHTINLQYKTTNGSDSVTMVNSSATFKPVMVFMLMPSN